MNAIWNDNDQLIEIQIRDFHILLPLTKDSTVSSISLAAFDEYSKFGCRNAPKKVA